MVLQYPGYDQSEFGCLNKDLAGIFAYTRYLEIDGRIRTLRDQIAAITSLPPDGLALLDDIQSWMLRIMSRMWKKEERPKVLDGLRQAFIEAGRKVSLPTDQLDLAKEKAAREIMNLYFTFDMKAFETDYQEIYFDECTNDATPKKLEKLRSALEKAEKEAADSDWKKSDPMKWFSSVPSRFRDRRIHKDFNRESMCRFIIETFVTDWRHRAVRFAVPVSVNGVSISTMPRSMSDVWLKAYKGLGLDKLERSGMFIPRVCDVAPERVSPPSNASIPKVFQPSVK